MEKMRYCKYCGKPVEPDARFCTECGTAVKSKTESDSQRPESLEAKPGQPRQMTQEGSAPAMDTQALSYSGNEVSSSFRYNKEIAPEMTPGYEPQDALSSQKKQVQTQGERKRHSASSTGKAKEQDKKKRAMIIGGIAAALLVIIGIAAVALNMTADQGNTYLKDGQSYLQKGQYQEAVAAFEEALKQEPDSVEARLGIAEAYEGLEEYSAAIAALDDVLELDSDNREAYGKKAQIYSKLDQTYELNKLVRAASARGVDLSGSPYGYKIPEAPEIIVSDDSHNSISITAKDKDVAIKYTIDGTEPTEASKSYEKSLEDLTGTVTVKAMAVNDKGIYSEITSKQLTLQSVGYTYNKEMLGYLGKTYSELSGTLGELKSVGSMDGGTFFEAAGSPYIFAFESNSPQEGDQCTTVSAQAKNFFHGMTGEGMSLKDAEKTLGVKISTEGNLASCEIGSVTVFIYDYSPEIGQDSEIRCKPTSAVR